jgi:hypothetical protein
MNGTKTALEHTEIVTEADWALAGIIPDGINATGLLSEDLEEYAGGECPLIEYNDACKRRSDTRRYFHSGNRPFPYRLLILERRTSVIIRRVRVRGFPRGGFAISRI